MDVKRKFKTLLLCKYRKFINSKNRQQKSLQSVAHPSTFTRAKLSIVANPLTRDSTFWSSSSSLTIGWQIFVPGAERLKIFLILIGMLYRITGIMVRGCNTFAPKYDCTFFEVCVKTCIEILNFEGEACGQAHHFPCLLIRQRLENYCLADCR